MIEISIVIPVFNEEENIRILYSELSKVLENLKRTYEIIFVDDGSTDNTSTYLKMIESTDNLIKIITFKKNQGKSTALSTGFSYANGEFIITMDGDLQDDPEEIPNFLESIKNYDLVVGWRYKREDSFTKILASRFFNLITRFLTGIRIHDSNCGFKIFRKELAKEIKIYGELHRYIPALAYWEGFRIGEIKVKHHQRKFGKSKYGLGRLLKGILDLITIKFLMSYGKRPLHFFGVIGIICLSIGFFFGAYLTYQKFFLNIPLGNRPALILSVLLLLLGIQFISIGLIGEMIIRQQKNEQRE